MIRYHGTPITPNNAALAVLKNRHGMVSFANPQNLELVVSVCESFVLDNGAFTAWKQGTQFSSSNFYSWCDPYLIFPNFDWALIPDVIDGKESENKRKVRANLRRYKTPWKFCPVWHLNESFSYLRYLCENFPTVSLGSSGKYKTPGSEFWKERMENVFEYIYKKSLNYCRFHGLRMMNPVLQALYPFTSVDSCTVGINVGLDAMWKNFKYPNLPKSTRALVLADYCESCIPARTWSN